MSGRDLVGQVVTNTEREEEILEETEMKGEIIPASDYGTNFASHSQLVQDGVTAAYEKENGGNGGRNLKQREEKEPQL